MKTKSPETTPIPSPRLVNAARIIDHLAEQEGSAYFRSCQPAGELTLPTDYLGTSKLVVPSFEIISHRGNRARLVELQGANPKLAQMYGDTVKAKKGMEARLRDMRDEALVRVLDTNGASGLHHIHGTVFPSTVYFNAKRGNGLLPNVYITRLGAVEGDTPLFAMITATRDKRSEYELFRLIGAGHQKQKYNP